MRAARRVRSLTELGGSLVLIIDARESKRTARAHIEHIRKDDTRYRVDRLSHFTEQGSVRKIGCADGPELGIFFTVGCDCVFDRSRAATMSPLADRTEIGELN